MAKKDSSKVERTPVTSENDNASFIKDLAQSVNTTLKRDAVMVGVMLLGEQLEFLIG